MDALAAYGAVVGTLGLGLAAYREWRDRIDVRVSFGLADLYFGNDTGQTRIGNLISVEAVNRGRHPVALTAYGFHLSDGYRLQINPYPLSPDPKSPYCLPRKLDPAESYSNFVALRDLQNDLRKRDDGTRITACVFNAADGRTFRKRVPRWSRWHALLRGDPAPAPSNLDFLKGKSYLPPDVKLAVLSHQP